VFSLLLTLLFLHLFDPFLLYLCLCKLLLFIQSSGCFQLLALTFLEGFLLCFLVFHILAHADFPDFPRRPKYSRALEFFVLLKVHGIALVFALLFGAKRGAQAFVFVVEEFI
jgi:hypothetical protein